MSDFGAPNEKLSLSEAEALNPRDAGGVNPLLFFAGPPVCSSASLFFDVSVEKPENGVEIESAAEEAPNENDGAVEAVVSAGFAPKPPNAGGVAVLVSLALSVGFPKP